MLPSCYAARIFSEPRVESKNLEKRLALCTSELAVWMHRGLQHSFPAEETKVREVRRRFPGARTPAIPMLDKYHVEFQTFPGGFVALTRKKEGAFAHVEGGEA